MGMLPPNDNARDSCARPAGHVEEVPTVWLLFTLIAACDDMICPG